MSPARQDPYRNFNFVVEIDGIVAAGFSEVSMPAASADVIEYREGGNPSVVRKLPGRIHFGNLMLRRGITASDELYNWWKTVLDGQTSRRNMAVILMDEARNPVKRWVFREAWPARYQPSGLDARGREVALETVEIVFEGMELAQ
ncbi:MAG: phage tail protein [Armatimonadetes bacterium RBG_16_67_12]|nr:MAG: phage tail protein [Armatimonadetes bacterium RBG_16_67_12]